ncbi:MAG: hypothetical protein WC096_06865 [Sphaerochaetaceae bacterium]
MICVQCGNLSDKPLCPRCLREIDKETFISRFLQRCPTCGRPRWDFSYPCWWCSEHVAAYGRDGGILASLLGRYVYGREKKIAAAFAQMIRRDLPKGSVCIPVPSSRSIVRRNGFDPVLHMARTSSVPVFEALSRDRHDELVLRRYDIPSDCFLFMLRYTDETVRECRLLFANRRLGVPSVYAIVLAPSVVFR